ncbi:MAG: hypothetical protein HQL73_11720 [Magnetococcales bacterium]|nr:hypothetical protein [Magnetococcales bacterium]
MLGVLTLNMLATFLQRAGNRVWNPGRESSRTMQETARSLNRTERFLRLNGARSNPAISDLVQQVEKLRSKWNMFVVDYVRHGCEPLFAERGIHFDQMQQRIQVFQDDGTVVGIDIMAKSNDLVVLVEVESTLRVADVEKHMVCLQRFRELFPIYADCRVIGAVAGVLTEGDVAEFARQQGLFVILHAGDKVWLANDKEFVPRLW